MTALTLADALKAYEMAVAHGASSIGLAVVFADLTAAHTAHVTRMHEAGR